MTTCIILLVYDYVIHNTLVMQCIQFIDVYVHVYIVIISHNTTTDNHR